MLWDFKVSYTYVNSHIDKLFGNQNRVGYFATMGVVMWRDDGCGTDVKRNDDGGWSYDGVVLWLGRRKNRDTIE
jgi:hypothetical protein